MGRLLLVALGTARYKLLIDSDLPLVQQELERVKSTFAAARYELLLDGINPGGYQLRQAFVDAAAKCKATDVLTAYYTGHGVRDNERFYLLAGDSNVDALDQTAVAAEDLARALTKGSNAAQVLLILDACYSAGGAADFARVAAQLATTMHAEGPSIFVIAAARPKQEAHVGALTKALQIALSNDDERLGGVNQPYLSIDEVMGRVDEYLRHSYPTQVATWFAINARGHCKAFPNPRFVAGIPVGVDLESQRANIEHWIPKVRGAEVSATGRYFTGRETVLRDLVTWLEQPTSGCGIRLVTGGPGSGKSALLARIVTAANPVYRGRVMPQTGDLGTVPPEGIVNVAIHARHKLLSDIVARISADLAVHGRTPAELVTQIGRRRDKTVIVLDSLDEAEEPNKVFELLCALSSHPNVFLLVAARHGTTGDARNSTACDIPVVELNLDNVRYADPEAVARFVEHRLLATEEPGRSTPYKETPLIARTIAKAVATRAGKSFLVAHTIVQSLLLKARTIDIQDENWLLQLPTGMEAAFDQFLAELTRKGPNELTSRLVKQVLMPLAYAEGEGLPWGDTWASVASKLSGCEISNEEISLVRLHAGGFIVEALEGEVSVYRLYHEQIAEHLRTFDCKAGAQRAIVAGLLETVPHDHLRQRPDWVRSSAYLLGHLATHASKAESLDELCKDGLFVASADPLRLRAALARSSEQLAMRAYRPYVFVSQKLSSLPVGDRISHLELAARQLGEQDLANKWIENAAPREWSIPWWRGRGTDAYWRLQGDGSATAAAGGMLMGQPIVLTGSRSGELCIWDLATGERQGEPLVSRTVDITAVTVSMVLGETLAVTGEYDGSVKLWNLQDRKELAAIPCAHKGMVRCLAVREVKGRTVVLTGGNDGTVGVWTLESGSLLGRLVNLHMSCAVLCAAIVNVDGRLVAMTGGMDGRLRFTDLVTRRPAFNRILNGSWMRPRGVWSAAFTHIEGKPVVITGDTSGQVCTWDIRTGKKRKTQYAMQHQYEYARTVTIAAFEGKPIVLSGGDDAYVRVWDLLSGAPVGNPFLAHGSIVDSVCVLDLDGHQVVLSSDSSGEVYMWHLRTVIRPRTESNPFEMFRPSVLASFPCSTGSALCVGETNGSVGLWDVDDGIPVGSKQCASSSCITSFAIGVIEQRRVLIFGDLDGKVFAWQPESGQCSQLPYTPLGDRGSERHTDVSIFSHLGRQILVCQEAKTVTMIDLASGDRYCPPVTFSEANETIICSRKERLMAIQYMPDGKVHARDLENGTELYRPLVQSGGISALNTGMFKSEEVVVTAGFDGSVTIWSLDDGARLRYVVGPKQPRVWAVFLGTIYGRPIAVTRSSIAVSVFDIESERCTSIWIGSDVWDATFVGDRAIVVCGEGGLFKIEFAPSGQ